MANTATYLRRVVDRLNAMIPRPALVLATGDLTERGNVQEYRRLRGILASLEIPWFLMPGNHDDRDALRRVFWDHAYLRTCERHASFALDAWPLRIVALDSTDGRRVGGTLDDERMAWLDATLCEEPGRPTIVALHHPPFKTGIGPFDAQVFIGLERFAKIVRRHHQIARIVSGHVHTTLQRPWNGTLACTAPSTSPQFVIGRSPLGIGIEAAGYLVHEWTWNADVATRIVRIDGESREVSA